MWRAPRHVVERARELAQLVSRGHGQAVGKIAGGQPAGAFDERPYGLGNARHAGEADERRREQDGEAEAQQRALQRRQEARLRRESVG